MHKPTKIFFKRELPRSFFYSFAIFFALLSAVTVAAWTGPPGSPPTCPSGSAGCAAPLNVSGNAQTKTGNLTISGTLSTGNTLDVTASLNNWAGIFSPNGAYGIYTAANSSGVYGYLGDAAYGLYTNGAVAAYSNNAGNWAGDFRGAGSYGMYVQNASGYYAEIAYSSYGILTNGSVNAPTFCLNGSCISSWSQAGGGGVHLGAAYQTGQGNGGNQCNFGDLEYGTNADGHYVMCFCRQVY